MLAWLRERQFRRIQKDVSGLHDKVRGNISDGYHSFDELYDHRVELYIALCKELNSGHTRSTTPVWRSLRHSDTTEWKGWFLLGINHEPGKQITYHLPRTKWKDCDFALTVVCAPRFDGHTSADVLQRLKYLTN